MKNERRLQHSSLGWRESSSVMRGMLEDGGGRGGEEKEEEVSLAKVACSHKLCSGGRCGCAARLHHLPFCPGRLIFLDQEHHYGDYHVKFLMGADALCPAAPATEFSTQCTVLAMLTVLFAVLRLQDLPPYLHSPSLHLLFFAPR